MKNILNIFNAISMCVFVISIILHKEKLKKLFLIIGECISLLLLLLYIFNYIKYDILTIYFSTIYTMIYSIYLAVYHYKKTYKSQL